MDPITLAIEGVGLGMQIFGSMKSSSDAAQAAQISKDEATQEQGINQVKQQQMTVEAGRMQLENVRNIQRARAMGLNAAVNQGAQAGSGLPGGLASSTNQGLFNAQGVNFALGFGNQIFGYNQKISQDKMQMADVQSSQASDQGLMSLGGSLMKAGPVLGAFGKGAGSLFSNAGNSFFGGGSPSGYGVG